MSVLARETMLGLVGEACRAPSVHNIQPARWRQASDDEILLFEDRRRSLPTADPTGHDNRISLGAAFEGLHLALSMRGFGLRPPDSETSRAENPREILHLKLVAKTSLCSVPRPDPLAHYVLRRRTFRGHFLQVDNGSTERLVGLCKGFLDIVPLYGRSDINEIAAIHDECNRQFLVQPGYQAELYRWIRFSKANPLWHRDGLTADALGLSRIQRLCGALLFRPRVFAMIRTSPLVSLLISEAARTRTSGAVFIFTAKRDEDPFLTGRRFYRVWLEICRAGFALCPMSALADSAPGAEYLHRRYGIPEDLRIVNVFRIGIAPPHAAPLSPRLPAAELLV